MQKKYFNFQPKGMNTNMSPKFQSNEYATYMKNIRITKDDNGVLSLQFEKGNVISKLGNITGTVIGTCVLNKYLVLFTFLNLLIYNVSFILYMVSRSPDTCSLVAADFGIHNTNSSIHIQLSFFILCSFSSQRPRQEGNSYPYTVCDRPPRIAREMQPYSAPDPPDKW